MSEPYRTKKRFGQHFLADGNIVRRILEAAAIAPGDRVLEIGPGLGVLTDELLARAGEVHVMEIDADLVARLQQRPEAHLRVHAGDALALDWRRLLPHPRYRLVANLPYNISTQIVFKLLDHADLFQRLVLMFQQEVGDRLAASPGGKDYGILSVLCRQYFDIRSVCRVAPGCFRPPPKVNSIVLAFDPLPAPRVPVRDPRLLVRVVKAAFNQRRKTLRNSLRALGCEPAVVNAALAAAEIDGIRRGETLSLEEFAALADRFALLGVSSLVGDSASD